MRWWVISPERAPNGGVHAIATGFQLVTRWCLAWESWYSTDNRRIYLCIFVFQFLRIFVFSSLFKMAFSLRKLELNWQQTNELSRRYQGFSPQHILALSMFKYQYISMKTSQGNNLFFWNCVWNFCNNSIKRKNHRKIYGL